MSLNRINIRKVSDCMKKYVSYENGITEHFTEDQLKKYFENCKSLADRKREGLTFESWLAEMIKRRIMISEETKIPKEYMHEYVCCIPKELETEIIFKVEDSVSLLALTDDEKDEAIDNAKCSKVCDLEDTIEIIYI